MKILIVDDSAFMRKVISDLTQKISFIQTVEIARNGQKAVEAVKDDPEIDLILMDIEMPVMDGLTALKEIKKLRNVPVIMLSSLSNQDVTIEALDAGAADFIEKPVNLFSIKQEWITDFKNKILMVKNKSQQTLNSVDQSLEATDLTTVPGQLPTFVHAMVIGASTGGPRTLLRIIRQLPAEIKMPIFIVQHMPKGFTASFAKRLNQETTSQIVEAQDGMRIERQVYLCPGDYHMTLENGQIKLNQQPKLHGTRPAVDYLFSSAAKMYRRNLVAVLLTGMGSDGAKGMADIHQLGGYTIAEDEASCVVFGMPRSAIELGVVNEILDLSAIEQKINQIVG
ncbi:chemotaxis-specific protein-glutamate methyltransferase CheB [Liquorilactobacillus ghanensis]|jgi:two-component system chemotaxis response regulator CheB|uniref:chemotaxis-specific protein-glutamate methyltransferase CheB n=1 Tax=Liquorilactobacillus ghanensis TaxID=399370 RepID=UPI0039ECBCE9